MIAVANARMYSVTPGAATAWRLLLRYAIDAAGVEMVVVDHPPPAGLPLLWARTDIGCTFMCGWPFAVEGGVRPIVAAPVPAAEWSDSRPVYRSNFIVAADSPFVALNEVFGRRFAFNAPHSHSGWNMPCAHLAGLDAPRFSALVGPYITQQRTVAAVADGEADLASIDSYVLDLLRLHDPLLLMRVRVIAATAPSPIPLLIGAHPDWGDPLGKSARGRLQAALLALDEDATGRALLAGVGLLRFARVAAADYDVTRRTQLIAALYHPLA